MDTNPKIDSSLLNGRAYSTHYRYSQESVDYGWNVASNCAGQVGAIGVRSHW